MSDLLDTIEGSGHEVVRYEPPVGGSSGSPPSGSPFDRLLDRLVPGAPPDDELNRALLYGAVGSGLAIGGAILLALLPDGDSIRGSGFYLVGKLTLANFIDGMSSFAMPLMILALLLLAATGALALVGRQVALTGPVCVAQPAIGLLGLGVAGIAWLGLLAGVALTVLIWVVGTIVVFRFVLGVLGAW